MSEVNRNDHYPRFDRMSPFSIVMQSVCVCALFIYEGVSKCFRTESITKYTLTIINTCSEETQRVMTAKLTRLTHK
jgi:hypothetical protein